MAKYKLQENGVFDNENGAAIPNDIANVDWVEYQQWLTDGGVPDPEDVYVPSWDNEGRPTRDDLLRATDWTRMDDVPMDTAKRDEFAAYRQALRDLPSAYPTYADVVWPISPSYPV